MKSRNVLTSILHCIVEFYVHGKATKVSGIDFVSWRYFTWHLDELHDDVQRGMIRTNLMFRGQMDDLYRIGSPMEG